MTNRKMTGRVLDMLLFIELRTFLLCAGVSADYGESDYKYFLYTRIINAVVDGLLLLYEQGAGNRVSRRDGYCVATFPWVLFTFFSMFPLYSNGSIDTIIDASFETISGFTTTGATVLDDIESLSHGMLFWRSLTQWIGSLGTVFFAIAVLPIFTTGGVQLFSAEFMGVTHDHTHPEINVMVKRLWTIYLVLIVSETVSLMFGGMSLFGATCQSFATTAMGGCFIKQNSISYRDSPCIEYVVVIFMVVSSVNFPLFLTCLRGKVGHLFKDEELHWFLVPVGILTSLIMLALVFQNHYDQELVSRKVLSQVSTVRTSCGPATDDYNMWPPSMWLLLFITMLSGGCMGSTSEGIKNMRLPIAVRAIRNKLKYLLHPNAVLPIRINKRTVSSSIVATVLIFFAFYLVLILIGQTALLFLGIGLSESVSAVISSIDGVGPGSGTYGPAYSWDSLLDLAKWVLFFLMLVGRLELFSILLLLCPGFWKNR